MSAGVVWVLIELLSIGFLLLAVFVAGIILYDEHNHKAPEYIDKETTDWLEKGQG